MTIKPKSKKSKTTKPRKSPKVKKNVKSKKYICRGCRTKDKVTEQSALSLVQNPLMGNLEQIRNPKVDVSNLPLPLPEMNPKLGPFYGHNGSIPKFQVGKLTVPYERKKPQFMMTPGGKRMLPMPPTISLEETNRIYPSSVPLYPAAIGIQRPEILRDENIPGLGLPPINIRQIRV